MSKNQISFTVYIGSQIFCIYGESNFLANLPTESKLVSKLFVNKIKAKSRWDDLPIYAIVHNMPLLSGVAYKVGSFDLKNDISLI